MNWSEDITPLHIEGKSLELRQVFAKAANRTFAKTGSKDESIFAGTNAVKIQERLQRPVKVAHSSQDATPVASPSDADQNAPTDLTKAVGVTIKAAEFDSEGHLVILMSDGRRVVTKGKAVENNIDQRIGISVNPVFDHVQLNTTANYTSEDYLPGMLTWNEFEDCLDIVQDDGSVLQVGLENYIQVINRSDAVLENGAVVYFSGVSLDEIPEVSPLIADGSIPPLYIVGVLTNTIAHGERGRATVLGKVRDIDTTGSDVNEAWSIGDVLYSHPVHAGKLTKVKPTAPAVTIAVAAVLKADPVEGKLLVRPVVFPRLFYGTFSSSVNQVATAIDTPQKVQFENTEIASGVKTLNGGQISTDNSGLYAFDFKMQLTSSNSSQKNIYIWARKNGVDIQRSTSKVTMLGNGVEVVPSWSFSVSMQMGDYFELMYAVDDLAIIINAPPATTFAPSTPSATMRVSQINL